MTCAICFRDQRGFGFQSRKGVGVQPRRTACSILCLDILARKDGQVLSLTHFENQAIDAASDAAGEYIETIGKSDLATMTADEWRELLKIVFVRSTATIQRLTDEDAVPF